MPSGTFSSNGSGLDVISSYTDYANGTQDPDVQASDSSVYILAITSELSMYFTYIYVGTQDAHFIPVLHSTSVSVDQAWEMCCGLPGSRTTMGQYYGDTSKFMLSWGSALLIARKGFATHMMNSQISSG